MLLEKIVLEMNAEICIWSGLSMESMLVMERRGCMHFLTSSCDEDVKTFPRWLERTIVGIKGSNRKEVENVFMNCGMKDT